jgi:hypothetical protein
MGKKKLQVMNMVNMGNTPVINPVQPALKFVPCGSRNGFREFLRQLADNCAPLNNVVNTMGMYIAGKGLIFRDAKGEVVDRASEAWMSLHQEEGEAYFRRAVSKDLALLGDRTWEVILTRGGQILSLYHIDAMRIRIGRKDEKGRIPGFFFCSDWTKNASGRKNDANYPVSEIARFGSPGAKAEGKGIMFAKDYHQGQDYYGLPWYLPALTDAEVWARIPVFNRDQLDTGFKPSFHIHVFNNADDADVKEIDENIEVVFTGADGKAYFLTTGTKDEGAPQLTKLERGDHAGELDKMGDRAEEVIYKSVGIPPILMGVAVNTGLGGQGLALDQSVTQFLRTQVQPRQWLLTDDALRIVQMMGVKEAVTCEVDQLMPFDAAEDPALKRQTYLRSHTVNEDRLADGLGRLTTDGKEEEKDGSNLDPKGEKLLIEVGTQSGDTTTGEPTNTPGNA